VGNTRFIGIDGRGGSGKSTLAALLARELDAEVIHTDDFASWDNPLEWHQSLIDRVFVPIAQGARTLDYMPSKWWDSHVPQPVVGQQVTEVMIVEGVSALRRELRGYIAFGIFVETAREICMQRGLQRDLSAGHAPDMIHELWTKWAAEEDRYLARDAPADHADLIVDGSRAFKEQPGLPI
jgi:uridine kinase